MRLRLLMLGGVCAGVIAAVLCVRRDFGLIMSPSATQAAQLPERYFPTLPPHAALPSGEQCAAEVRESQSRPEMLEANTVANHTVPTRTQLAMFHLFPIKGSFAPASDFWRVDGQFTGTTDEILRWGACKWGVDEDVVRAEAAAESHWLQSGAGDSTGDPSLCPSGTGFHGAWDGSRCMQSYGIMQMKYKSFGGWPLSKDSTAFNVDFRLAYQRACMNGDINYLAQRVPEPGYPTYPNGSTDQMMWGCMGDWFSGGWYDKGALHYIAEVKSLLARKGWRQAHF